MATHLPQKISLCLSVFALTVSSPAWSQASTSDELEEIVVSSQRQPYRGDTPLESLPQAVQVLSSEVLTNLGVIRFQDALDLSASVARQNNFGGIWDMFAIRGLAGDENSAAGYLVNGFSAGRGYSGRRDTSNIESIEIMKGPGSALYGRSEPGGTINLVTKKPQFDTEGYVKARFGEYDSVRLEGDYTGRLTDSAAFRINGAWEESDGFRNTHPEKISVTPSLLFVLADATSLSYELEFVDQEVLFDRGIVTIDDNILILPPERYLGDPNNGPMKIESLGHQVSLQHEFANDWTMHVGLGYRDSSMKGYAADTELSGGRQLLLVDGETVTRQRRFRDYQADDLSGRIEFSGAVEAGITHHLLVGLDTYEYEHDTYMERWRVAFGSGDTTYSINAFDPDYSGVPPDTSPLVDNLEKQGSTGIYIQDQMDLTDRFKVLLGVRFDDFDQTIQNRLADTRSKVDQTETSLRAGVVFDATQNITLYGSYSEGFRPNTGADFEGRPFDPEKSESSEVGLKWTSDSGELTGSVAFFTAEKSNILTADPINSGFSAQLGEADSEGVEIDLTGNITDDISIFFSYAYINAETANDVINADWGVAVPAGSRLINVPENSASLALNKAFEIGSGDASAGFSVIYVGDRLGETIDTDFILPSYTLLNLFASYAPNDKLRFGFHLDNVTDEEYIESSYHKWWMMPGQPATYSVSLQYSY